MKRYKLGIQEVRSSIVETQNNSLIIRVDQKMIEDPEGEWVKWEDVKVAVTAFNDWVEWGLWPITDGKMKCNCEEMYEQTKYAHAGGSKAEWFCPAHGYKRR